MAEYYAGMSYQDAGTLALLTAATDSALASTKRDLEKANQYYSDLALYKDCLSRITTCNTLIASIEQEQAARAKAKADAVLAAKKASYEEGVTKREAGDWIGAVSAFKQAGNYSDAATQILATYYAEGEAKRAAQDWDGAVKAFKNAGKYNPCEQEQHREVSKMRRI